MTTAIKIYRVSWGFTIENDSYNHHPDRVFHDERLVLEDEVEGLVSEVLKRDLLGKRGDEYNYIGVRPNTYLRVDTVEPENIDNERLLGHRK
jgi:hypothetical protein